MSSLAVGNNRGLTTWTTATFIVSEIVGPGVLGIPKAVNESGWIGVVLVVICAIVSAYSGVVLGKAWLIVQNNDTRYQSYVVDPYSIIGEKAYGKYGRYLVTSSVYFTLIGMAMIFLILAADNIEHMIKDAPTIMIPFCFWIIILAVLLMPFVCFGEPRNTWFWRITVGVTMTTLIGCVMLLVQILLDTKPKDTKPKENNFQISNIPDFYTFFRTFGTVVFAFGGHPALPTIQTNMEDKTKFKWAVIIGYLGLALLYFPVTIAGLFVYGKYINENILKSGSDGPSNYVIQTIFTIHCLLGFVIVINPVCQAIESRCRIPRQLTWKRCIVRPLIVIVVLFVALSVPCFRAVLSLVGGLTVTLLAYICPSVFYLKLCRRPVEDNVSLLQQQFMNMESRQPLVHNTETNMPAGPIRESIPVWERLLHYTLILVGLFAGIAATVASIKTLATSNNSTIPFFTIPCYVNMSIDEPNYVHMDFK